MSLSLWEYVFCSLASTLGLGLLGPEVTRRLCLRAGALYSQVPRLPMASQCPFTLCRLLSGPVGV